MNDGPTKTKILTLMLIAIFCVASVIYYIVIKDEPASKTTPPLRRYNYEPVYVQLNNEQFERLIEALKGNKE